MTLEGTKIAIDTKTTPGKIEVGAPEQGTQGLAGRVDGGFVTQTDIDADNGVIHVIDGVASPKVPLIGQNGGYVAGTEPGSGEGRTGLDTRGQRPGIAGTGFRRAEPDPASGGVCGPGGSCRGKPLG